MSSNAKRSSSPSSFGKAFGQAYAAQNNKSQSFGEQFAQAYASFFQRAKAPNGIIKRCYRCDSPDHLARDCRSSWGRRESGLRRRRGRCFTCGKHGHKAYACSRKGGNGSKKIDAALDAILAENKEQTGVEAEMQNDEKKEDIDAAKVEDDMDIAEEK